MFKKTKTMGFIVLMFSTIMLAGCGGSAVESGSNDLLTCSVPMVPNAAGNMCVAPPPFNCAPPTIPNESNDGCVVGADPNAPAPSVSPGPDQAVLYYNRAAVGATNTAGDASYEGYRLHTWNNDACSAYADSDTDWGNGRVHTGIDVNYGAYWLINLKPSYAGTAGACGNFIIHKGDDKEMRGGDFKMPLSQDDPTFARMNFVFSGEESIFEFPIVSLGPQPVKIEGQAAHWLDANTLLWDVDLSTVSAVKLHYSAAANLTVDLDTGLNGTAIELEEVELSDEQKAIAPHLADLPAFHGEWTAQEAKQILKAQAVLASYDSEGLIKGATGVQLANAIDQLYTTGEADADEAQLGPIYGEDGSITAAVWAPTAQTVKLVLYNDNKTEASSNDMTLDNNTGIWSYSGGSELDRAYYRFEVTVYHPKAEGLQKLLVTDPYSVSLSTNSRFSQFVNLNDEDLKPDGWDDQTIPTLAHFEDAVIYEGSIRDFSVRDSSTTAANRGKYMAFTEMDSAPVTHLKKLADKGLTHFHMLPANDIASIEEDVSKTVNMTSTLNALCKLNRTAPICKDASVSQSMTLGDLFASYASVSEGGKAQELAEAMRGVDQFNWGYDPFHFNVPEGSYATNPEGVTRIKEMRAMNMALHEVGLRVALDVVYNHTNASELSGKSVLDKVVPGYYHRYEVDTGAIVRETCCDDTEPRNAMMEKLMKDSLIQWATQYKFDSFRFDIMSQASKTTMVRLFDAVKNVDEDTYFYGEGWPRTDRGFEQAGQINMAGTEIGTFNDRIREAVRQGQIFSKVASDGALAAQDKVKMGLAGTLTDYVLNTSSGNDTKTSNLGGYATDPADIINYVSKHDGTTLWDEFNYVLPVDLTLAQRVRAQNVAATIPLMAQGIPFLQIGGDFLRSKSMDKNSYDSGDWFSYVDFTMATNNWNVGLPLAQDNQSRWDDIGQFMNSPERAASMSDIEFASEVFNELLSIRSTSPLFRLTTGADVIDRVGFHNIGKRQTQGLIVMSIDDGISADVEMPRADLDPMVDAIVVVINSSYTEQSHTVPTASGFELHATLASSIDPTVRGATFTAGEGEGTFTVPALTTAVFVKAQSGIQGVGLASFATSGAPDVVPYGDTGVYLRGTMFDWTNPAPSEAQFAYKGAGIYTLSIDLVAGVEHNFKIAKGDWDDGSQPLDLGVPSGDSPVVVFDEEFELNAGGGDNIQFTAPMDNKYQFTLIASDVAAPKLMISYEEPYFGTTVYLRGEMNDWADPPTQAFTYQGEGIYSISVDLQERNYRFKVASADWSTVNFGSGESDFTMLEAEAKPLGDGENLAFAAEAGKYTFLFNAANKSASTVTVSRLFGTNNVYLRGSMNGWSDPPTEQMIFDGKGGNYATEIDIDAGSYSFKVASADWSAVNLGAVSADAADKELSLGIDKDLGNVDDNNLSITIPANGTYRFEVNGEYQQTPNIKVTEVTP